MFSKIFETIEGIAAYPIISMLIFLTFFIGVIIIVVRMKKEHIEAMGKMPLDDEAIK
jgi:cytochrome c oxidase cbb3-type subunit IV